MNDQLDIVTQHLEKGVILETCCGKMPDKFRQLHFGPIAEFEVPDIKVTDSEFQEWLIFYRRATLWVEPQLLEMAKCN